MKKKIIPPLLFISAFIIYFAVGTQFTFRPKWALDYFNPLAQALLHFRLDIPNPSSIYDLADYHGKWYGPWGILPAVLLIPLQLIKARYIPTFYLNIFFASLNVAIVYLLLLRIKKEFFPNFSSLGIFFVLIFFAFGTTQFYIATLGSQWHVDQMLTSFLGTLGIYKIFRKKRKTTDYVISSILFALTLLGRPTIVLLIILPISLYIYEFFIEKKPTLKEKVIVLKNAALIFCLPLFICSALFFAYNYLRFQNIFEYGFSYIHESGYLAQIREENGAFSIRNIPKNLWYMLLEMPSLSLGEKIGLAFNLNGNSLLFLSSPFLGIFLASPFTKVRKKISLNPYVTALFLATTITLIPSLMHYGSGWMQFGYRFSLDVNVLLLILSVFGLKGNINTLYILGTIFSIVMYVMGIVALY